MPISSSSSAWLTRYATATALATLGLIGLGGLVTSHGAGMAVPDWPTTYGYNMFLFPVSQWVGGIFYEHTHRLYASGVGLLTLILAFWLHFRAPDRRLARLGWLALALVIVQGVLGGIRVSLMKDQIGVFHAALAQAFLVLLALIALGTTRWWRAWIGGGMSSDAGTYRWAAAATVLIFVQLLVGATMRHQHAGLAVPDFPLAYGRIWPPSDPDFLHRINALRLDTRDFHPITAFHVHLHMGHRWLAAVLAVVVVVAARRLLRAFGTASVPGRLGIAWMTLLAAQILMGAWTVWSNKAADIATLHVVVGASCLVVGAMATAMARVAVVRSREALAAGRAANRSTPAAPRETESLCHS